MKPKKITEYWFAISPTFPSNHKRKGEETHFIDKIFTAVGCCHCTLFEELCRVVKCGHNDNPKLHTIRKNYPLWVKRMEKIQRGEAVLVLFFWEFKGGRFREGGNNRIEFARLDKDSGCGVQKIKSIDFNTKTVFYKNNNENIVPESVETVSKNDGLSSDDFKEWFKNYDLSKSLCVLQFTKFRY